MDEVRRRLDVDEPDYPILARELGPDAAPHLHSLVKDGDEGIASKAAYLASLLPDHAETLALAAHSPNPAVRVAAAAGALNLADDGVGPLDDLLDDADVGVRKAALRSAAGLGAPGLRSRVERIAQTDSQETLRQQAAGALSQWPD